MSLSVVIPSHNPEAIFFSTIKEVIRHNPQWHVILVDDASDIDLREFLPDAPNLTILRNETSRGAGASRNIAIDLIRGDYTVFLDDDDFMDWDVVKQLMADLEAQPAIDMAISSYKFLNNGKLKPAHTHDLRILNRVLGKMPNRVVAMDGNEDLLRLTNFPWNKVYRNTFIRRIGLRFSETAVQNDIYAHWQSIMGANRILVTNLVQCTKTDNVGGLRISNTADNRRLQAFVALRETYDMVRKSRLPQVEKSFWGFYYDLARWMINVSRPDARPALMREHISFAAIMPPGMKKLENASGTKKWEIWDMDHLSDMLSGTKTAETTALYATDPDIFLTEISRLKHLATELRNDNRKLRGDIGKLQADVGKLRGDVHHQDQELGRRQHDIERLRQDNERLRQDIGHLDREVNSKAARTAIRIRTFYRSIFPGRGKQQR